METNVNQSELNGKGAVAPSVQSEKKVNERRKSKQKNNFERVLESARRLYDRQVLKDANTWKAVIETSILSNNPLKTYKMQNFLSDLGLRVFRLLDSKRFERDCEKYQLDLLAAAVYISLHPITRLYSVLDFGLDSPEAGFNGYICDMGKRIFEYDDFPNREAQLGYKPDPKPVSQDSITTNIE